MPALTAICCDPPLAAFYQRLRDRGKQPKLALVTVMHKVVAIADALLRANRLWQASVPPVQMCLHERHPLLPFLGSDP